MKLFAINETEWVAAKTEEDAIECLGLEKEEVESINEIPENEWDELIECYDNDEEIVLPKTIRELMKSSIESGESKIIMSEQYS